MINRHEIMGLGQDRPHNPWSAVRLATPTALQGPVPGPGGLKEINYLHAL